MRKDIVGGVVVILCITVALCGCQAGQVNSNKYADVFQSDVVTLVNYTLNLQKDKSNHVVEAAVDGKVQNLLNKMININITVDFYDKNNNLLGMRMYEIFGLRNKSAPGSSTTFSVIYDEMPNVAFVDHIKMRANEII